MFLQGNLSQAVCTSINISRSFVPTVIDSYLRAKSSGIVAWSFPGSCNQIFSVRSIDVRNMNIRILKMVMHDDAPEVSYMRSVSIMI